MYLKFRDIDNVCDLMEGIGDDLEIANEISEALSSPMRVGADDEVKKTPLQFAIQNFIKFPGTATFLY